MENTATPVADPAESTSLADHEQAFAPGRERQPDPVVPERADDGLDPPEPDTVEQKAERERDDKGQFTKQRAKSQRAGAEDVEKINAYTKRIREAEESLGIKVEKQPGESERVYQLRRRAELLEAKREAARVERQPEPKPLPKAPEPFTDEKPKYEDFAHEEDQYAAWMLATAKWERRKDEADGAIKSHETQRNEAIAERNRRRDEWFKARESEHLARMAAYHDAHPQAQAILDNAGDVMLTPALYSAIMTAENSPELLILVASQEELRDDLTILTDGKPVTKELVALVQRRLNRGLTAGTTGSAPAPAKPVPAVPRPPNPVRTGPMTAPDTPPGDEDSLAAHEKFYGRSRR
jgi:hypothetical protein